MITTADTRTATQIVTGMPVSDGAGVKLFRVVGTPRLAMVDPFLMLDEFRSDDPNDYLAGFPSHPHRGFETVTIMLAGAMEHKDSVGNTGHLGPGSVQWMTAGRGIIHSEMPKQIDGLMWGFQLWVNLPADAKMTAPRYQDIPGVEIPTIERPGAHVRVIAGTLDGTTGPVRAEHTEASLFDVALDPGTELGIPLPPSHAAFVYVYEGSVRVPGHRDTVGSRHAIVLSEGARLRVGGTDTSARFLIFAGRPLDEPVARYGPFVMNTTDELREAFADYQAGRLA
jgi:quercetin 2,3-dioxygenase